MSTAVWLRFWSINIGYTKLGKFFDQNLTRFKEKFSVFGLLVSIGSNSSIEFWLFFLWVPSLSTALKSNIIEGHESKTDNTSKWISIHCCDKGRWFKKMVCTAVWLRFWSINIGYTKLGRFFDQNLTGFKENFAVIGFNWFQLA